jgi:hypothetical protein
MMIVATCAINQRVAKELAEDASESQNTGKKDWLNEKGHYEDLYYCKYAERCSKDGRASNLKSMASKWKDTTHLQGSERSSRDASRLEFNIKKELLDEFCFRWA